MAVNAFVHVIGVAMTTPDHEVRANLVRSQTHKLLPTAGTMILNSSINCVNCSG